MASAPSSTVEKVAKNRPRRCQTESDRRYNPPASWAPRPAPRLPWKRSQWFPHLWKVLVEKWHYPSQKDFPLAPA